MDFISLPRDLLIELLLSVETADLLALCSTNRSLENICNNENFWRQKVQQLNLNIPKPANKSWKQHYIYITRPKNIPLTVLNNNNLIGTLNIKFNDTIETVLNNANELFFSTSNTFCGIALLFQDKNNKIMATIANPFTQPTYYNIHPDEPINSMLYYLETLSYVYPAPAPGFHCTMAAQALAIHQNMPILPNIYPLDDRYLPNI